jgi:hypothetical protein
MTLSALQLISATHHGCRDPIDTLVADFLGGTQPHWRSTFELVLDELEHCFGSDDLDVEVDGDERLSIQYWRRLVFGHSFASDEKPLGWKSYDDSSPNWWRGFDIVMRELHDYTADHSIECDGCEVRIWEDASRHNGFVGDQCVIVLCRTCCPDHSVIAETSADECESVSEEPYSKRRRID